MSGTTLWTPLGPDCIIDGQMHEGNDAAPVSGRVTCLQLVGANLYVGTAGGGLWRSSDEGLSWTPLTDTQPCLAIGALGFDAASNTLVVGTGEGNSGGRVQYGQGLLVHNTSTGAFQRVTDLPSGNSRFKLLRCTCLLFEPAFAGNPAQWWLGTTDGLFRSTDGGTTWTEAVINSVTTLPVVVAGRLEIKGVSSICKCEDASGPLLLIAVWGTQYYENVAGTQTLRTLDGGVFRRNPIGNFDPLLRDDNDPSKLPASPVGRGGLAVAPSNAQRVYAVFAANAGDTFAGLYMSATGGQNWTKRTLPSDSGRPLRQSSYNLVLVVHPTNPDTLIFGDAGLWRSTDGGISWTHLSQPRGDSAGTHSDQHVVVYDPAHPGRVWLGNDGGVWRSDDGGDTWRHRNRGLNTLQYYALVHHGQAESVLLAGAQDNGTQRFAGHAGWNLVGYGDGFYCGIDNFDPRYWFSSYTYRNSQGKLSAIQRSDKAGKLNSWRLKCDGIDPTEYKSAGDEPFFVPFMLDAKASGVIYLGTSRLWRSTDRGDSWLAVLDAAGQPLSFVPPPNPPLAAGATPPKPSARDGISAICVDPNDSNTLYVGTCYGNVFRVQLTSFDANGQARATQTRSAPSLRVPLPALPGLPAGSGVELPMAYEGWVTDLVVAPRVVAGGLSDRPVYVAFGSDYLSGALPRRVAEGRVWKADFGTATPTWTPLANAALDVAFASGPNLPNELNFANALAVDPTPVDASNPPRLFVGCHIGVYEFVDSGGAGVWTNVSAGLPNAPVVDLQFHPTRRLLRAATMGRSVWERFIGTVAAPSDADVFIRDNIVDLGRFDTPANATDPLSPPDTVDWFDGVDIKVDTQGLFGGFDTPSSSTTYAAGGPIDYIGFQQLDQDRFQRNTTSKVYVQVGNRGPQDATVVLVRAWWAHKAGEEFPDLPADFWTAFPNGALAAGSAWKPVGDTRTVGSLRPGAPAVVQWDFKAPELDTDLGILAIVTSSNDPVVENRTSVQTLARTNKHVVLRKVAVTASTASILATVLVVVGVLAVGAVMVASR